MFYMRIFPMKPTLDPTIDNHKNFHSQCNIKKINKAFANEANNYYNLKHNK